MCNFLHFAEQLYKEMIHCSTEDKGYYSAHFVSLQRDFVKDQPPIVKNLIRLVKYWRKTCIDVKSTGKTRLPSSYPLELITIDCWEKAGEPLRFDIRAGFKDVLQHLVDNCDIDVIWYKYYDKALAERGITGMSKRFVFVPVQGKSQGRPRRGECLYKSDGGQMCKLIPLRVLKSRMTTGRVIAVGFTVLSREACDRNHLPVKFCVIFCCYNEMVKMSENFTQR